MLSVTWVVLYALVTITLVTHVRTDKVEKSETVAELYEKGVEAYLEERFPKCVEYLEQALQTYRSQTRNLQNCRLKCRHDSDTSEPLFPVDIEDLKFYEKSIRNTLCIVNCRVKNVGNDGNMYVGSDLHSIFEERKPYEYLHLCYYKVNDRQHAASAAFTFLVANPDHKVMKKNLQQYSEQSEVNMKELVNFEAKDYIYLYVYGADAYEKKDWDAAINNMEESIVAYLQAEDECRAQCEGPYDPGWYPDFIPAISNHFTFVLKCKRRCKQKLGSLNGAVYEDLLASHYDYLQYAYFKKGNLHAACQAVASYLLFLPDDESMLSNMRYYESLPKVQGDYLTPREEAVKYAQRDTYEQRILHFIKDEFTFENKLITKEEEEEEEPAIENESTDIDNNSIELDE